LRLLLDSHVVLWLATADPVLPRASIDTLLDGGNEVLVSTASIWELEIKRAKGRLSTPVDLLDQVEHAGFRLLDITPDHALDAARLPPHHGDPFDRILVAQAQSEAAVLVTHDGELSAYDVPVMRAWG
jgi:PIN domain nuclease of toxin-antitoxin system